jgi:hypothetical protein
MAGKELSGFMPEIGTEQPVIRPEKVIPKRDIDKKVEEMNARRKLPPLPGREVPFEVMQEWLALLTDEMWETVIIRLYRLGDPHIDTRLVNGPDAAKYIDTLVGPFNRDYMIDTHGGGKFEFYVNGEGGKELFRSKLTLSPGTYEPKIDIHMLDLKVRDNAKWITYYRGKGLLDSNNNVIEPKSTTNTQSTNNVDANAIVNGVLAGFDRAINITNRNNQPRHNDDNSLGNTVGTILVEQMKQNDPTKLATLLQTLKGTDSNKDVMGLIQIIVQMQNESNNRMMELIKEIRQPAKEAKEEKSVLEQMKDFAEVAEVLGFKVGRGGNNSIVGEIMEGAKAIFPPVANLVSQIIQANTYAKMQQNQQQQQQNQQPQVTQNPGSNVIQMQKPVEEPKPSYGSMGVNPNPEPKEEIKPEPKLETQLGEQIMQSGVDPTLAQIAANIRNVGPVIQKNILDGKRGYEIAEWAVGLFGAGVHGMVAKHGVEQVIAGMKLVPEFWQPLDNAFGEEYMHNWVGEFINYEEIIQQMDEGEEDADSV